MLLCYKLIRAIRQPLRPYRFDEFIERKELKMANYIIKYFGKLKNKNIDFKNKLCWFDLNKEFDYRLNMKYGYIYSSSAYNELISNVSDCFVMAMIGLNEMHKEAVKNKFNYVYLISGTHKGITRYKIGKANDVEDRLKRFEVKIPFDIDIICSFMVKDAISFESYLHKLFSEKRLSGEWFDLTIKDIKKIKKIGLKKENEDGINALGNSIEELKKKKRNMLYKDDKSYISYLESLLVFNEIDFISRLD